MYSIILSSVVKPERLALSKMRGSAFFLKKSTHIKTTSSQSALV